MPRYFVVNLSSPTDMRHCQKGALADDDEGRGTPSRDGNGRSHIQDITHLMYLRDQLYCLIVALTGLFSPNDLRFGSDNGTTVPLSDDGAFHVDRMQNAACLAVTVTQNEGLSY